jgi:hypothetical protein
MPTFSNIPVMPFLEETPSEFINLGDDPSGQLEDRHKEGRHCRHNRLDKHLSARSGDKVSLPPKQYVPNFLYQRFNHGSGQLLVMHGEAQISARKRGDHKVVIAKEV